MHLYITIEHGLGVRTCLGCSSNSQNIFCACLADTAVAWHSLQRRRCSGTCSNKPIFASNTCSYLFEQAENNNYINISKNIDTVISRYIEYDIYICIYIYLVS